MKRGKPELDARPVCLKLLRRWEQKRSKLDEIFSDSADLAKLDPRDRALAQEILFGVIRKLRRIDYLLDQLCKKGLSSLPGPVRNILQIGAYQLLYLDRIPAYAAIDSTVALTEPAGFPGMRGMVNAVLRRLSERQGSIPLPDPEREQTAYLGVLYSFPDWLVEFAVDRWGLDGGEAFLEASNRTPAVYIRANRRKGTLHELIDRLEAEGVPCTGFGSLPDCARLEHGVRPDALGAFREGRFVVQDPSAQLPARLLDPKPDEMILDCCAAPGGKATQVAELMADSGKVMALDRSSRRLTSVVENAERLGLKSIVCGAADMEEDLSLLPEGFDRILADVPCSGLGVLARRPDLRWRMTPEKVDELAAQQLAILENVSKRLKAGGVLVYSTCTLTEQENRGVIRTFLKRHADFRIEPAQPFLPLDFHGMVDSEGLLETLPHRDHMDGSFAVRMIRSA